MSARKLATLGDASVGADDLALLMPPNWMGDDLLSFWCEHVRLHVVRDDPRVALILPNLAFFVLQCHDDNDVAAIVTGMHLERRELVVAPLNNSKDDGSFSSQGPSGTHWSVLVFERASNSLYAMDSLPGGPNRGVARRFASRLAPHLQCASEPAFVELDMPAQQNSYDCGAYACMFVEQAVALFATGSSVKDSDYYRKYATPESVEKLRQEIGKLISHIFDRDTRT